MVSKSSTESKIVRAYNVLPQVPWMKNYLEDQDFAVKETNLYQVNMNPILLEKNGKQLSSKHMKHMDIQFFHGTEHVQNKNAFCEALLN